MRAKLFACDRVEGRDGTTSQDSVDARMKIEGSRSPRHAKFKFDALSAIPTLTTDLEGAVSVGLAAGC